MIYCGLPGNLAVILKGIYFIGPAGKVPQLENMKVRSFAQQNFFQQAFFCGGAIEEVDHRQHRMMGFASNFAVILLGTFLIRLRFSALIGCKENSV